MAIIKNFIGYSYNDISTVPVSISSINSRSECNPYYSTFNNINKKHFPIFTAPMSTVVNLENIELWENNNIIPIIPRNISYEKRYNIMMNFSECKNYHKNFRWIAYSLSEFKSLFCFDENNIDIINTISNKKYNFNNKNVNNTDIIEFENLKRSYYVLIDLANGHMKSIYDMCNIAKENARKYDYELIIMVGNIANPETYKWICKNTEVDYVRLSVGSGSNCVTTSNTSIHYPIASLIEQCYQYKKLNYYSEVEGCLINGGGEYPMDKIKSNPYIIADGGIRGYADVIKALALGADYVMIGGLFTSLLESAGEMTIEQYNTHYKPIYNPNTGTIIYNIDDELNIWDKNTLDKDKRQFIKDMKSITKESYGMSTKKAQRLIDKNAKLKTSEGCTKYIPVTHTINQWSENMESYLKSAMSYTDKRTINEFKGNVDLIVNSPYTIASINK